MILPGCWKLGQWDGEEETPWAVNSWEQAAEQSEDLHKAPLFTGEEAV